MNKDDILAKSRQENKSGDERESKIKLRSDAISASIGAALCMIVGMIEMFVFDRKMTPMWIIYSGIYFSKKLMDAIKLKKRSVIIAAVFWGLLLACWVVLYVSDIVKVIG